VISKEVEFVVKLRDASLMLADAANEYLESLAPPEVKEEKKQSAAVQESTFNTHKFDVMQGAKIGEYELASEKTNLPDKWCHAYNVLRKSNATIQSRYQGEGYAYSYWLYGEGKIYRQKLKAR
jgi:hypothetical protein